MAVNSGDCKTWSPQVFSKEPQLKAMLDPCGDQDFRCVVSLSYQQWNSCVRWLVFNAASDGYSLDHNSVIFYSEESSVRFKLCCL